MSKAAVRPYLVAKDEAGSYRVTLRQTRYNSQGYPLVTSTLLDPTFEKATQARAYIKAEFRGEATDIATK